MDCNKAVFKNSRQRYRLNPTTVRILGYLFDLKAGSYSNKTVYAETGPVSTYCIFPLDLLLDLYGQESVVDTNSLTLPRD